MPRLSREQCLRALGMLDADMNVSQVSRFFGCPRITIRNLVERYNQTGAVDDRPRAGRGRVTTPRQDRHIRLLHLRNRFRSASQTAQETPGIHNPRISSSTVHRRLHEHQLRARRPVRGNPLTPVRRRNRYAWTHQRRNWNQQQWNSVLFSDESRFCIDHVDGRQRVWRRRGERFANCCVMEVNRWGGASVMVWAGISFRHRTPLVFIDGNLTARRYIAEVLEPELIPFLEQHQDIALFQQDNARPHIAQETMDYLHAEGVAVIPWPAFSPDLSPIEHLWDQLGQRVYQRPNPPRTRQMLVQALEGEWEQIPQDHIRRLIRSMRQR